MEIWFISALGGAVLAGLSNFYFKQAAAKEYNAELFTLYGGLISIFLSVFVLLVLHQPLKFYGIFSMAVLAGGFIAAQTNIFKVHALRFIDSTIYFPLYKLLAPAFAILAGVTLFQETFTVFEWLGMILGLLVPLLLITPAEKGRQNNLLAGLILILVTAITSVVAAVLNKYATDALVPVSVVLFYASVGICLGTVSAIHYKRGLQTFLKDIKEHTTKKLLIGASLRSIFITASMALMLYAYTVGGTLAAVQTVHSFYILIPIVLAIVLYSEHWNIQKIIAIVLTVASGALLH